MRYVLTHMASKWNRGWSNSVVGVADVLDEDEAQHEVLVLRCIHVGAQLVSRRPQNLFDFVEHAIQRYVGVGRILRVFPSTVPGIDADIGMNMGFLALHRHLASKRDLKQNCPMPIGLFLDNAPGRSHTQIVVVG